jgi:hypothetical protein
MHIISTSFHHHTIMSISSTTMCNCNTIMCSHSITPQSIIRYLNTRHREEIEVDTEVEDEVEEDLDEAEVPIVYHNCQQPRHYARECPLPPVTCMYCCAIDHDTEDYPTLLGNIQKKRNNNN